MSVLDLEFGLALGLSYDALLRQAAEEYQDRRVRVPKGAPVRSAHPHAPRGWHPAGRGQTVTVAQVALDADLEPILAWPGSAGYWKDVRAADVELLD